MCVGCPKAGEPPAEDRKCGECRDKKYGLPLGWCSDCLVIPAEKEEKGRRNISEKSQEG